MSAPTLIYRPCISTFSLESCGVDQASQTGGGAPSSATWPAAKDAILVPLYLQQPTTVTRLWVCNGSTASGSMDVGIYSADGSLITSSGSTSQSGTTALQFFNITDKQLAPGAYYLACSIDGTGGTVFRSNLSVIRLQTMGVVKATSAMPLPTTVTFATVTSGLYPLMGIEVSPGTMY